MIHFTLALNYEPWENKAPGVPSFMKRCREVHPANSGTPKSHHVFLPPQGAW